MIDQMDRQIEIDRQGDRQNEYMKDTFREAGDAYRKKKPVFYLYVDACSTTETLRPFAVELSKWRTSFGNVHGLRGCMYFLTRGS